MDSTIRAIDNTHAAALRQRAATLLEQLVIERERLEEALCEHGRLDQFKAVTGTSSLDTAIASTRRMIADLDLNGGVTASTNGLERDRARRNPFTQPRTAHAMPAAVAV